MKLDPIRAEVLCAKIIPNVNGEIAAELGLKPGQRSLGLLTATIDDVAYTAVDEATKKAEVEVIYAQSMYAGSGNATTKLAGEFIGILAGPDPEEVKSGLEAAVEFILNDACFYSANDDGSIPFYAQTISRSGSFLSKEAGIQEGEALAYLIAPPLEAVVGLDAAMKAADVRLAVFYGPPSRTNFGGGLLTGSQPACAAACEAFRDAVLKIAGNPADLLEEGKKTGNGPGFAGCGEDLSGFKPGSGFVRLDNGAVLREKPEHLTHLRGNILVPKNHPRIRFRGMVDTVEAQVADLLTEPIFAASQELGSGLEYILEYLQRLLRAEVLGETLQPVCFNNWNEADLREYSHHPEKYFGIGHMPPGRGYDKILSALNRLRASVRELEIAGMDAFYDEASGGLEREDIPCALNRLSSLVYVLMCRYAGGNGSLQRI